MCKEVPTNYDGFAPPSKRTQKNTPLHACQGLNSSEAIPTNNKHSHTNKAKKLAASDTKDARTPAHTLFLAHTHSPAPVSNTYWPTHTHAAAQQPTYTKVVG